jgi:alkylated DNA repair dioxygenase AlkB
MNALFVESFLTPSEAPALLACIESLTWTRGKFMGHAVPREEIWIGPYRYKFSGRSLEPAGWTGELEAIRDKIQVRYGGEYNSVLLNRYVNAQDSVAWHSDDEPEMDSNHPIASISLGAPRAFLVRPITRPITNTIANKKAVQTYMLTSGSLLLMPPGFQQTYEHCVPKSQTPCGPRVNLTFRRMRLKED